MANDVNDGATDSEGLRQQALQALREGDFDFALRALDRGEASLPALIEDLRIYQAELRLQNEELRDSQLAAERASRRFANLFAALPIPALVVSELGVIMDGNAQAGQYFGLRNRQLRAQFLPRLIDSSEHARLRRWLTAAGEAGQERLEGVRCRADGGRQAIADLYVALLPGEPDAPLQRVITVVDQTERHAQLRKLELDAQVFRNSREGVMMTDDALRIVSVNEAFSRITGYAAGEVLGGSPKLLRSGRHTTEFYAGMWQALKGEGYWQGEVWNRRKNGEVYPQWMGISAVAGADGRPYAYIAVFMDISAHKEAEARIEYLAQHDALTGLPNRLLLRDRFELARGLADRERIRLGMMYLDLDHFKNVNDTLGHAFGDRLLVETAARIRGCVRESDTVSRMGGDEFVVLLNNIHQRSGLLTIAGKLLEALSASFAIDGKLVTLSCSVGVCIYPDDGADFDSLLSKADTALYQAKSAGRNNCKFFTDEMNRHLTRRMAIEEALREAMARNHLYLAYQPQFDSASGRLQGVEALARWHHEVFGAVSPEEFIAVAEECGLIIELGRWVLWTACRQARQWLDEGRPLRVAVNVSSLQFKDHGLLAQVEEVLAATGLPAELLELELTETILARDTDTVLATVKALDQLGVGFAIDDFGVGYSSLGYLRHLPVDKLKIDRSFLCDVPGHADNEAIVTAIVTLAHSLGLRCVAEGVETVEQADFLRALGCDQLQGFLLAPPLSAEDVVGLRD